MNKLILMILCMTFLLSCSENDTIKPNSKDEAPEIKQDETKQPIKKDPVPKTITIQEVSRIALVEAEQFITNAKMKGVDFSAVTKTLNDAKIAYDNKEFKNAVTPEVSMASLEHLLTRNQYRLTAVQTMQKYGIVPLCSLVTPQH